MVLSNLRTRTPCHVENETGFGCLKVTPISKGPYTKVGFFIATDEDQPSELFDQISCIIRVGYPLENLYSLTMCDYLIGPPSSYISWASIYSGKQLYSLKGSKDRPTKLDFINIK